MSTSRTHEAERDANSGGRPDFRNDCTVLVEEVGCTYELLVTELAAQRSLAKYLLKCFRHSIICFVAPCGCFVPGKQAETLHECGTLLLRTDYLNDVEGDQLQKVDESIRFLYCLMMKNLSSIIFEGSFYATREEHTKLEMISQQNKVFCGICSAFPVLYYSL